MIVLPNAGLNTLELYTLPPSPSSSSPPAALEPTLSLALPRVAPTAHIRHIWCRAEPNAAGPFARAPFLSDPARAVILFNAVAEDVAGATLHYLSLVVHRAALLALLPDPSPPSPPPSLPSSHSSSSPSPPSSPLSPPPLGPAPTAPVIEWRAWGPPACLWLDGDTLATRWITVACGQRLVAVRRTSPAPLQVYDFNARAVRRREAGAHASTGGAHKNTDGAHANTDGTHTNTGGARTRFVRRTALRSPIFAEPVESELVHAVTETAEEYGYESVMMDEGVLIGVEVRRSLVGRV